MRLVLTGRHLDISPGLRTLVDRKLVRLERLLGNAIVSAQVVCVRDKDRLEADVTVHMRGDHILASRATGATWSSALTMRELEGGLRHHSLITNEEQRKRFTEMLSVVRAEYDEIVKNEVQRAITADEAAIKRLSANYIDNIKAYTQRQKVRNPYTGQDEPPNERLMRAIEEKIEIPESRKDDFRREIMNYIGALAIDGKTFSWDSNDRLRRALEMKLFEDQKDSIKLTSLVSNVVDKETQEKIEVVKNRLIKNMGYCEICAGDVLNYVASIFARGDTSRR